MLGGGKMEIKRIFDRFDRFDTTLHLIYYRESKLKTCQICQSRQIVYNNNQKGGET